MKKYKVTVFEVYKASYIVEAEDRADAYIKWGDGEGNVVPIDTEKDYVDLYNDSGIQDVELSNGLKEKNIDFEDDIILGVHSIEEI
jgi:uncharacterized protein YdaT